MSTEKITVLRKVWGKDDNSLFIYGVIPSDPTNTILEKHKIYKSYSVFSEFQLFEGEEIKVELSKKTTKSGDQFWVNSVHQEFPETPEAQWRFLENLARTINVVKLINGLESAQFLSRFECPINKILSIISKDDFIDPSFSFEYLDESSSYMNSEKFLKLYNSLKNSQNYASFCENLGDVSKAFTQTQAEKLIAAIGTPQLAVNLIKNDLFKVLDYNVEGIGFKTMDSVREKLHAMDPDYWVYKPDSEKRIRYGSFDVLKSYIEDSGNTMVDLNKFYSETIQGLGLPKDKIESLVEESRINDLEMIKLSGPNELLSWTIVVIDSIVTTADYWNAELRIYRRIKSASTDDTELLPNFEQKLDKFLAKSDYNPSDEQREFFTAMNENKISMIVGPGGTGKTRTVAEAIQFLNEQGKKVQLLAPTGKAAQNLSKYAGYPASTIHKAYRIGVNAKKTELPTDLNNPDVIFIDEFSMVDSILLSELLKKTKSYHNTRFVVVGDEFQLPSVSPGNILHVLIREKLVKTTRLTKSFRVKSSEGGILQLATEFREGRFTPTNNDNEVFTISKDLVAQNIDDEDAVLARTLGAYKLMLKNNVKDEEIMVLSPSNKGTLGQINLNNMIQDLIRAYYEKDLFEFFIETKQFGVPIRFYQDDLVIFKNNRTFPTADSAIHNREEFSSEELEEISQNNGDIGRIIDISANGLLIKNLISEEVVLVFADEVSEELGLGYAYTIHKSQGSESKYGIMVVSGKHYYQANSNLLYTGITRFKERCYLFASFKTLRNKVKVFENKKRETLLDFFIEKDKESNVVF